MAVEYTVAHQDILEAAWKLIAANHADLAGALNKGELAVVFRDKASKAGGQVVLGTSKKSAPLINALSGESYVFILELAMDQWGELEGVIVKKDGTTANQQEALLDHLLSACRADYDEKKGTTKFFVAKPDVMAFRENVERYGMWFPKDDDADEVDEDEDATNMFSSDDA